MFVKRVAGAAVLGMALLFGFSPLAPQAQAGYVVTLQQQGGQIIQTPTGPIEVGSAVIAKGGGTIDLTGLTKLDTGQIEQTSGAIAPVHEAISTGPTNPHEVDVYTGLLGATDFGSTGPVNVDSGEGDIAGVIGFSGVLLVPHGYISGTPLSDTATYLDKTFFTLGAIPGIYEWEWGGGPDQNFTLIIGAPGAAIPEPASLSLLGVMLAGLLLARPRRQPRGNETRE